MKCGLHRGGGTFIEGRQRFGRGSGCLRFCGRVARTGRVPGPPVLFMQAFPSEIPPSPGAWRRDLLLLVLVFGILLGFRLGSAPLANPDEGRYTEIPREMIASGDWVTPRLNGVNYFEKPPLMYWTVAACLVAFGPGEWAMRLTPAVFALGGVLLTYAAGRRFYGRSAGLAAAAVLGSSLLYYGTGRFLVLDMMMSVLMSATLFCFILAVQEPPGTKRRWLFYGLYASAALATLTKGFIGFLVTGAVMFLWLLVFNQWRRLRPLYLPTGVLLFLAIALPWHLLAAERNPTWAHRYIVFEHWERFTTTAHGRSQPWHFFIWIVIAGLFPWTGFLWGGLREAVRGGWAARKEHANAWFFITWAAFIFLFFSKSQSKLPAYILPIFPALAVLIGAQLARGLESGEKRLRGGFAGFAAFCGLLAAALGMVAFKAGVIRDAAQAAALRPYAIGLAVVLAAGGLATPWLAAKRGTKAGLAAMAVTTVVFFGGLTLATPEIQRPGTKAFALRVKAEALPGDRVVHYREFFHDFTFYAERVVDVVGTKGELELEEDPAAPTSGRFYGDAELRQIWAGPQRVWLVTRKRDMKELTADPAFRYQLLGETRDHYLLRNRS